MSEKLAKGLCVYQQYVYSSDNISKVRESFNIAFSTALSYIARNYKSEDFD